MWLAVPVFLVMAGGALPALWMRGLSNTDAMANKRRDMLIATLRSSSEKEIGGQRSVAVASKKVRPGPESRRCSSPLLVLTAI